MRPFMATNSLQSSPSGGRYPEWVENKCIALNDLSFSMAEKFLKKGQVCNARMILQLRTKLMMIGCSLVYTLEEESHSYFVNTAYLG